MILHENRLPANKKNIVFGKYCLLQIIGGALRVNEADGKYVFYFSMIWNLPDFLKGDGGVVPYLPVEFETLLLLHVPPELLGGVPILN